MLEGQRPAADSRKQSSTTLPERRNQAGDSPSRLVVLHGFVPSRIWISATACISLSLPLSAAACHLPSVPSPSTPISLLPPLSRQCSVRTSRILQLSSHPTPAPLRSRHSLLLLTFPTTCTTLATTSGLNLPVAKNVNGSVDGLMSYPIAIPERTYIRVVGVW